MNVAVVGATGAVGETILRVLEERRLPIDQLGTFASRERDLGARFRGNSMRVRATSAEALGGFDVVFFAGGEEASEAYAPALIARGAVVIDNSASFRLHEGVPLIVPKVNGETLKAEHRLLPVANCTAIVLCSALRPVRDVAGLRRVSVATYQAASGAGRAGIDEFLAGERALVLDEREPQPVAFSRPLARNVVPQVGRLDSAGWTGEERKIRDETRKMLDLPELHLSATAVRVPVRTAHSAAVFVETQRPTTAVELARAFERAPGIVFHRDGIVTPREVEGTDEVHVARLRVEPSDEAQSERGTDVAFWCVGDQLRTGAATNAVEILELLLKKGYLTA
ncbi:MAG: aspartate-semialdehyde dehydrogenase [Candidatus Eremiobacteraeota bacterium]|nr:aspartate-semialdehyde dehydrogenase [Candidatus Eremiobacteraeota bacterium]